MSSIKFIKALSNLAPLPISVIKRLFDILVDLIESKKQNYLSDEKLVRKN